MPIEKQQLERLQSVHQMLVSTMGTLSYNDARGLWFYTIPSKWKRASIGSGATPEQAIENACKQ